MKEYIESYGGPHCRVESVGNTFCDKSADSILRSGEGEDKVLFVLDCIDNTETKAELLAQCLKRRLRVVSSMGAGSRADPTRLHVSNISEVKGDELGRAVRMQLTNKTGLVLREVNIPCVWSSETARKSLVELTEEQRANPEDFGNREGFRLGIVPVMGTVPAMFGALMAAKCMSVLQGPAIPFLKLPPMTEHLVTKLTAQLLATERRIENSPQVCER